MLQALKKGKENANAASTSASLDGVISAYSCNFVNNVLLLAIRYFMDEKTPGILRVVAAPTAAPIFRGELYELLNKVTVAELDSRSKIELIEKVNDICGNLQKEGLPLDNLWGDFIKASFMDSNVLDLEDKRVEHCWKQFAKKLRTIFKRCLNNEKNDGLDIQHHNYAIHPKDQEVVTQAFFSFMKQLLVLGQRPSVQAIHNLFHIMSLCASNQPTTGISDFDISVLMRPVLLGGFKLENKLCHIKKEHEIREHLFPEWCFMGTIALFLMKSDAFSSEFNDSFYLDEEKEHKQRRRSYSLETADANCIDRKSPHNNNKKKDLLKKSNSPLKSHNAQKDAHEKGSSSFVNKMKEQQRNRKMRRGDSIALATARGVPLLPESSLTFLPAYNSARDDTETTISMIETLTLCPRRRNTDASNHQSVSDEKSGNGAKGSPKNK